MRLRISFSISLLLFAAVGSSGSSRGADAARLTASRNAQEQILYSFQGGNDGANPLDALVMDSSGSLYGTTVAGGTNANGTVFKLTPSGGTYTESVIWRFTGGGDGAIPYAGLIIDSAGALYGAATAGGSGKGGVIFKLTPKGTSYSLTPLYQFGGTPDGAEPFASLTTDASGNLYGTTVFGGTSGDGTVFKLTPSGNSYTESALFSFSGTNGKYPWASVTLGANGTLYGTAQFGGANYGHNNQNNGVAFMLTASGNTYVQTILEGFRKDDGGYYPYGGLTFGKNGSLLGYTFLGGQYSDGTVFELTRTGSTYSTSFVHNFKAKTGDGAEPYFGVLLKGSNGEFYGTTTAGGTGTLCIGGCGTVYEIKSAGKKYSERVVYSFQGGTDGAYPQSGLIADPSGALYGTTYSGGEYGYGTVFKVIP